MPPYGRASTEQAFERSRAEYGQYVTGGTNALLSPPPEHVLELLGAGNGSFALAHRFVNGFDDPVDF